MGTRLKNLDVELIKQAYLSGKSLQSIADDFGVSRHTIRRRLLWANVSIRQNPGSKTSMLNVDLESLKRDYLAKMPFRELEQKYGIGIDTIHLRLDMMGVPRNMPTSHTINEHFFDDLSLEPPAYWLGILMADGYMSPDRPRLTLSFSEKDKKHLERFKYDLGSSSPLIYKPSCIVNGYICKPRYKIQMEHPLLYSRLVELGVTPRKSHTLIFPHFIPDISIGHFLRGFLDGDGCIYYRKPYWVSVMLVSGSEEFLSEYEYTMRRLLSVPAIKVHPKPPIEDRLFRIRWSSKPVCAQILRFLYLDCTVALPRKLSQAMHVIKELE